MLGGARGSLVEQDGRASARGERARHVQRHRGGPRLGARGRALRLLPARSSASQQRVSSSRHLARQPPGISTSSSPPAEADQHVDRAPGLARREQRAGERDAGVGR